MSGPPRRPLLWPWLLLLLLLVGTGIALAYFLTRDDEGSPSADGPATVITRPSNTVEVPQVVGLDFADAFERVQAAGLRARSVQVSARQAKGRVIRQRPPAGAGARRGATVVLTSSKGPQLVAVPQVVGQREADATAALRRVGLRVDITRVPAPGPLPEGVVVAQSPKGGVRAPRGSTARLNISTGGPSAGGGSTQTVPTTGEATVPSVVGSRDTDASARLQAAGFRVTSAAVSSTRAPGTVLAQAPVGGTATPPGSTVRITVSGGRQVLTVPDVVGETESATDRILRGAGFTVRVVDRSVKDPVQDGLVVEQDPRAGTRVQGTTSVTVYVGRLA